MKMPSGDKIGAVVVVVIATAALVWAAPTNEQATFNLFRVLSPMALLCGVGLMVRGLNKWLREGQVDHFVEGNIAAGLYVFAWGHDTFYVMVRRAAEAAGYTSARLMINSDYRVWSAAALCVTGLWLLRWVTLPTFGEWGWVALFMAWGSLVLFTDQHVAEGLVWIFTTFFRPASLAS